LGRYSSGTAALITGSGFSRDSVNSDDDACTVWKLSQLHTCSVNALWGFKAPTSYSRVSLHLAY